MLIIVTVATPVALIISTVRVLLLLLLLMAAVVFNCDLRYSEKRAWGQIQSTEDSLANKFMINGLSTQPSKVVTTLADTALLHETIN